jgi:hypothetical protein
LIGSAIAGAFALSEIQRVNLARSDEAWLRPSVTDAVAKALESGVQVVAVVQENEALKVSCSAGATDAPSGPSNTPPPRPTVQVSVTIN